MLTRLQTVRARIGLTDLELQWDTMLTAMIMATSARFERICKRKFARAIGVRFEFNSKDTELVVQCYPVESVMKFESKANETEGWIEETEVEYVIRNACVISLAAPVGGPNSKVARVTYTGGYVLPGMGPGEGQTVLPQDIEHAATEQVVVWWQQRDKLGLVRHWPENGIYLVFSQLPLLPFVTETLKKYERWSI